MILVAILSGCLDFSQPPGEHAAAQAVHTPGPFDDRLLEIARSYETYGRVDDEFRWAPTACAPPAFHGAHPHFSSSDDGQTHGQKLYSLFATHLPQGVYSTDYTYHMAPGEQNPVGGVAVKEAWVPEEVKDKGEPPHSGLIPWKDNWDKNPASGDENDHFDPYVRKGGRLYHAARKAGLFIMFKMDPQTPGTDIGWVYGTVTADGRQVTSAGRVASCMGCHKDAPYDRLFGLRKDE